MAILEPRNWIEPVEKLIETLFNGVGQFYEPIHIRRMAKARAKEISIIGKALTDNLQLPIKYENGNGTRDELLEAFDKGERMMTETTYED